VTEEARKYQGSGLPDSIFKYEKSTFGFSLERLGVENFGIIYGIWNIKSPFDMFYGNLVYSCSFGNCFPILV
jgi:hypothetical protein